MFEFVDVAKLRSFVIKCLPYVRTKSFEPQSKARTGFYLYLVYERERGDHFSLQFDVIPYLEKVDFLSFLSNDLHDSHYRLIDDLNHKRLVGDRDEATMQMITLALTGRALNYFHNGVIDVDSDGNLMVRIAES